MPLLRHDDELAGGEATLGELSHVMITYPGKLKVASGDV